MTPLDAALSYAARGIAVFAVHGIVGGQCTCGHADCRNKGKHPTTLHGLKDASKDPAVIRRMFRNPRFNVAIRTGEISGFWVLDLDSPAASEAVKAHEADKGVLPATPGQATGRGEHLCFAWDPAHPVRNMSKRARDRIGPDIDVRGDDGYIVAPPSAHLSGRFYRWSPGRSPLELAFAPAPPWLLAMVSPAPEPVKDPPPITPRIRQDRASAYGEAALDNAVRTIQGARVGSRDTTLYRTSCAVGCLVAGGEIEAVYARQVLVGAGGMHVPDAMSQAQLERQVDRALAFGAEHAWAPSKVRPIRSDVRAPAPARFRRNAAPAALLGDSPEAIWAESRSPWVKAVGDWFRRRGLEPGDPPGALDMMRVHPSVRIGPQMRSPCLVAPMIRKVGDPVTVLACLPLDAAVVRSFCVFLGDPVGRVICLAPLDIAGPLLVAIDLQDAWALSAEGRRRGMPVRAVIAPRLRSFAGGFLGDQWGRVEPSTPLADPADPPWRHSGEGEVFLAVRRDLRSPTLRRRAFAGGTFEARLEGEEAASFFGGVARQHWLRDGPDFVRPNAVRLLQPHGRGGFHPVGE